MEQYIIALAQKAKEAAPVMALQTSGKRIQLSPDHGQCPSGQKDGNHRRQ